MKVKRAGWLCWLTTWQHRVLDRGTTAGFRWHRKRGYVKNSPRCAYGLEVTERGFLALGAHHRSLARHQAKPKKPEAP